MTTSTRQSARPCWPSLRWPATPRRLGGRAAHVRVGGQATTPTACSLTAPCRGFAAALVQTNPGGEIVVLDSAGYGPVTITKAVSIVVPPGIYAGVSVTVAGTDGIVVSAGADATR